jgi:hypothetical protein
LQKKIATVTTFRKVVTVAIVSIMSDSEDEERVREEQERRTAEQEAHHHANNCGWLLPQDMRVRMWSAYARQDSRRAVQQLDEVINTRKQQKKEGEG